MFRQVCAIDGRPTARSGRGLRLNCAIAAAVRYRAAPASSAPRGDRAATSTPPTANPQICMMPTDMWRAGRSVLYYRTAAGETLVAAQLPGGTLVAAQLPR